MVFVTVGTAEEGRAAAAAGADVIVAQGWEAGGHVWGTVSTLALVPRVVDAVAPVPVVAAGGIADGRGLAAVLALGAAGAWVGTRFLAAQRQRSTRTTGAASSPPARPTPFTARSSTADGRTHRTARFATRRSRRGSGRADPHRDRDRGRPTSPRRGPTVRQSTATHPSTPTGAMAGDVEPLPHWAGQGVGLVTREETAADIVASLVGEAEEAVKSLGRS